MNVIIPGTFDLFHEGHERLIEYGHQLRGDDELVIIVNGDRLSISKGKTPEESCATRMFNVEQYLEDNDISGEVIPCLEEEDTLLIAQGISPCVWLTGRDWNRETTSARNGVEESFWEENNIYLVYKDRLPNISSTELRR